MGFSLYSLPTWDTQFTVRYQQTRWLSTTNSSNLVVYYYDFPNRQARNDYSPGHQNPFCLAEYASSNDEPCTHLIANDGWRYLLFPQSKNGCRCCNTSMGCGMLKPDWV